ncbi:toll/interleukin-1 receptor domain-containing protein [Stappia sp. P2PMeth1]|uniref:toll/interleukin-1 receptor domain-containing protein n=1 Tax=Stappia sp. P2PMeth1 TaxID=2003586 RepID=UPI001644EE4C|nr:toll/interleukin-1 receptor domain-containing protein [Stappia sp. P2PMeth1]
MKNGPWGLVVDWYRAILKNSPNAKPRSLFGQKADIAIATRPNEFWTVSNARSAEDILSEIAEIGGYEPSYTLAENSSLTEVEILRFLEEVRRPATLEEIHAEVTASHPSHTISVVQWRLETLERGSRIIRTSEGLYVHPKWTNDNAPDWDFFLSYSQHDLAVARRISDVLEDEGYAVFSQFNDMTAGKSFVGEMNRGLAGMGRMIAAYSPDYFSSSHCQSEWEAAYTADPSGKKGKIVPFMVRPCDPPPLARRLVWTSLLGLSPEEERAAVLRAVRGGPTPRDRVAQRAAMKAAASPDVGLDPSGQKLDALPNKVFDQPFVDEDLFELPERLRGLIGTILDVLEGRNAPRGLATALRSYVAELEARGANCSLGVLRDQMAFVEAEVDDPEAEYWCSGAGLKTSIATLRRHHALLLTHYPLDQERERLLRAVEIDEEKFSPDESRKLRDEIRDAVREALADDSVTEGYRDAVENRARVVRDTLDLRTPDVPTDGDPEYTQREQDRRNRVRDAKKRALAQEAALADKTLDVIGKMAKIADSPAVQKLARSMRDLAEWFWSS